MDIEVKPTLAQRIDDVIRDAMGDVIAEAREEGWRTGYAAGRLDVRREMNGRLRALILEEEQPEPSRGQNGKTLHEVFDDMFRGLRGGDTTAGVAPAQADARPPADAGGATPVKAAEGEPARDALVPQPIEAPAQAGGEGPGVPDRPPALPEPPTSTVADALHERTVEIDNTDDDEPTAAAVPAAAPAGPGAEPALNQAPPPPQQNPEADPVIEDDDDEPEEVPGPPAPHAAAPAPKPVWPFDWRTDDRKKVFIEAYERGDDMTVIRLALADMSGPRMPDKNAPLWAWVTGLKIKRGTAAQPPHEEKQGVADDRREPAQHSAAEPPRERPPASHPSILPPGAPLVGGNPKAAVIPLPQPRENGRVYTSFHNIRAWAGVYNIAYDGTNLDRVNTLRIAKSLPLLVQDET